MKGRIISAGFIPDRAHFDKQQLKLTNIKVDDSFHWNQLSKKQSQKEIEIKSLLYAMRRKSDKLYNKHLRLISPVLNRHTKFWKLLTESEQNAKAFSGWLEHMRTFYDLIISDPKYKEALNEYSIDLSEFHKGLIMLQGIQQTHRKLQKCICEKRLMLKRINKVPIDFDSVNSYYANRNHYVF
ncbi:hypothetical protein [Marinifilum caeruleilacunae]|uniref:CHAD domain-containing protein n=1 Tax=Marinifilum caeruleilacunae TaxID=2499076 RepID=A0ABX1X114_9BACT|nr:hypothetical protein [Marinifilum caeruleilacunae]NOU62099.1 hypothetical protein [Marinifilum caeruleilacunae]